jgi:transcriptional regulator with XRE-family HTH domain
VTPDDIKDLRKTLGITQKALAEALKLDVALVRDWEKGELFPTRAHCEQMEALRKSPPPRRPAAEPAPMALLADPGFFTLLRKLLAHRALRQDVEKLAAQYSDPLEGDEGEGAVAPAARRK